MRVLLSVCFTVFVLGSISIGADEVAKPDVTGQSLKVGIHDKPPYAFQDAAGEWDGLAVRLWEGLAKNSNLDFSYVPLPFEALIPQLAEKKVDIVMGEILVNPRDEQVMDFSQPFLETHIGVAVSIKNWHPSWWQILLDAFDWNILRVFLSFIPGLMIISLLIWWVERKRSDGHFGGRPVSGIGSAFWFSAVTMTSTGFGDKVPVTFFGRMLATIWMILSLLLVTAFTASVASTVASVRTGGMIRSVSDLQHYRNAVLNGSVSQQVLEEASAPVVVFETYEECFDAMLSGDVDTVAGDMISFQYLARTDYQGKISLLPIDLFFGRIAFGLHQNSPHREEFNVALLKELRSNRWQATLREFLGPQNQIVTTRE